MLVLSVKPGESVTLDNGITVTFIERRNGQSIRLGFVAPDDVGISRLGNVADCRADRTPEINRGDD